MEQLLIKQFFQKLLKKVIFENKIRKQIKSLVIIILNNLMKKIVAVDFEREKFLNKKSLINIILLINFVKTQKLA